MDPFLQATEVIDCDHPQIKGLASQTIKGARDVHERARLLFYLVRDTILYNLYVPFFFRSTTGLVRRCSGAADIVSKRRSCWLPWRGRQGSLRA